MDLRSTLVLARSAVRAVGYLLDGRVVFRRDRLGDVLKLTDGTAFVVYRETTVQSRASADGVVLVFRMRVADPGVGEAVRDLLFDPLTNVATPFFAGMPGFRRKLWLAGERPGEFLELYEWATRTDADRFVGVLESLLAPLDFAGSASFEVLDNESIDEYVDARTVDWRDAGGRAQRLRRRSALLMMIAALGLVALGYLVGRGSSFLSPRNGEQT